MLSATQALQKAKSTTRWAVGMCDNFVANMFGYTSSGYTTAISHWNAIPANDKHPGDTNPPAGALVFWSGGAGHVALSTGNGGIISTDYPRSGMVSAASIDSISNGWGKSYLGWSVPVFQGQTGSINTAGWIPSIPGLPNFSGGSLLDFFTGGFGSDIKDLLERLSLFIIGGILITVGVIQMSGKDVKLKLKGDKENAADKEGKETQEGA